MTASHTKQSSHELFLLCLIQLYYSPVLRLSSVNEFYLAIYFLSTFLRSSSFFPRHCKWQCRSRPRKKRTKQNAFHVSVTISHANIHVETCVICHHMYTWTCKLYKYDIDKEQRIIKYTPNTYINVIRKKPKTMNNPGIPSTRIRKRRPKLGWTTPRGQWFSCRRPAKVDFEKPHRRAAWRRISPSHIG